LLLKFIAAPKLIKL